MLDLDIAYTVQGWSDGIAWRCLGYEQVRDEDYEWTGIEYDNTENVLMVMIGDDEVHIVPTEDIVPIPEGSYCRECGQVGCGHS